MVEARCMKCKEQVEMKDGKEETMANGRNAMRGSCPKCGTKVFRILGNKK
jgi:DNA-directed RNA polymerase subunit RPC12/RpoP